MDYEAMCYRCQELEKFDSEGEKSSESASSQDEEEEDNEEDRDASPIRKKKDPHACEELSECDLDEYGTPPEKDTACPNCLKFEGKRASCECCGGECCQLCHYHYLTHKNHGMKCENGDILCEKCYYECDSSNGETWHKEDENSEEEEEKRDSKSKE